MGQSDYTDNNSIDTNFDGIIDGRNHTIYNLYQRVGYNKDNEKIYGAGLVGLSYSDLEIRNLNMKNVDIGPIDNDASKYEVYEVGALVGSIWGDEGTAIIENCTVDGIIGEDDSYRIGGLVGSCWTDNLEIRNCINYCNISGIQQTGGIIGQAASTNVIIENCINYGEIEAKVGSHDQVVYEVGGITGELSADNGEIRNCTNEGNIYIEVFPETKNNGGAVAGIAGYASCTTISKCINKGDILDENVKDGNINIKNIGGIVGEGLEVIVDKSINSGNISCKNESSVGGIIGGPWASREGLSVENCYNTGNIEGKENVGGIIGVNEHSNIKNCYNIGKITGLNSIGGITAINKVTTGSTIENSYYLNTSANIAYTTETGEISTAEVKTEEEMKQDTFVDLLNQNNEEIVWIIDDKNNGYPRLNF